jgi:hypothetical protein
MRHHPIAVHKAHILCYICYGQGRSQSRVILKKLEKTYHLQDFFLGHPVALEGPIWRQREADMINFIREFFE